jgi:pyridoxamine 5'-phosphate oxidase
VALENRVERTLLESETDPDPFRQFHLWLADATQAHEELANAMALGTVDLETGMPSVRMVLLETLDERGFVFQTNRESPKARDLAGHARAAATFFWPSLVRQVRVSGAVEELSRADSRRFYAPMPADIQAMLHVCRQSEVIADRAALERIYAEAQTDGRRELPDHWGAYRLVPEWIEFFQGRQHWLQDRLRYTRTLGTLWRIERLVP